MTLLVDLCAAVVSAIWTPKYWQISWYLLLDGENSAPEH